MHDILSVFTSAPSQPAAGLAYSAVGACRGARGGGKKKPFPGDTSSADGLKDGGAAASPPAPFAPSPSLLKKRGLRGFCVRENLPKREAGVFLATVVEDRCRRGENSPC